MKPTLDQRQQKEMLMESFLWTKCCTHLTGVIQPTQLPSYYSKASSHRVVAPAFELNRLVSQSTFLNMINVPALSSERETRSRILEMEWA